MASTPHLMRKSSGEEKEKRRRLLTKKGLMKIKAIAMRRRVWFKVLSRAERAIVDLTVHCVERVRSPVLLRTVLDIIGKILKMLESKFLKRVEAVGSEIAEKVCRIALDWGNVNASSWRCDTDFIRFLGVNAVNIRGCEGE